VDTVQDVVAKRIAGDRPSRFKSFLAATAVGFTAAAVTYRLLRRGGDERESE
jgi:hypothetical protein